jgi:hypothetical protein
MRRHRAGSSGGAEASRPCAVVAERSASTAHARTHDLTSAISVCLPFAVPLVLSSQIISTGTAPTDKLNQQAQTAPETITITTSNMLTRQWERQ